MLEMVAALAVQLAGFLGRFLIDVLFDGLDRGAAGPRALCQPCEHVLLAEHPVAAAFAGGKTLGLDKRPYASR